MTNWQKELHDIAVDLTGEGYDDDRLFLEKLELKVALQTILTPERVLSLLNKIAKLEVIHEAAKGMRGFCGCWVGDGNEGHRLGTCNGCLLRAALDEYEKQNET